MSRIRKLLGILTPRVFQADDGRREPQLAAARKLHRKKEPALTAPNWQAIKENLQAEVRGLVSKSVVESIYGAQRGVSPEDQDFLLQAAANRLYADVLYEILSESAKPPFEPAGEILQWAQEALDDAMRDWQGKDSGVEDGKYEPPIEAKRSTTDAIFEALKQATKNEVLQEAAKKRFQVQIAMVAAE